MLNGGMIMQIFVSALANWKMLKILFYIHIDMMLYDQTESE